MARKELPADYIGNMTQLDMVLDARKVLEREGASDAMWAANTTLIKRYSNGAWTAEGHGPAVKVGTVPAAPADHRPADRPLPTGNGNGTGRRAPAPSSNAISDAQRSLLERLINDNITSADSREALLNAISTLTKKNVGPVIDAFIKQDNQRKAAERAAAGKTAADLDATLPPVPDGRYRIGDRNIKVSNGTGRWTGRVFLVELDDDASEMDRITRHADKLHLLTEIAADPYACVIAFGKATGACGNCDTHLEDPESIARGIGPYCEANRLGIPVAQVYRDRKAHPVAKSAAQPPAAAAEITEDAPAAPAQTPATPAAAAAEISLTAAEIDAMTFAQLMTYAKQLKVPGRGTARLPQLRAGVKAALALAA